MAYEGGVSLEIWWGGCTRRCERQRADAVFYGTITYLQWHPSRHRLLQRHQSLI